MELGPKIDEDIDDLGDKTLGRSLTKMVRTKKYNSTPDAAKFDRDIKIQSQISINIC